MKRIIVDGQSAHENDFPGAVKFIYDGRSFTLPPAVIRAAALAQEEADRLGEVTKQLNNFIFDEDVYPSEDGKSEQLKGFFEKFQMTYENAMEFREKIFWQIHEASCESSNEFEESWRAAISDILGFESRSRGHDLHWAMKVLEKMYDLSDKENVELLKATILRYYCENFCVTLSEEQKEQQWQVAVNRALGKLGCRKTGGLK